MLAVSNTSPLYYLVAVDRADLLAQLFGRVLIPSGVSTELADPARPEVVRAWIACPPAWIEICPLEYAPDVDLCTVLDLGEREAIQLAIERKADVLIMDERKGRAVAKRRGVPLTGALGVLGDAYKRRLINDPLSALGEMRQQGFRVSERLVAGFAILLKTRYAR